MPTDIRLIGLDLDGTTLNEEKQITPRVRGAIQRAIAAGIEVLPATGRAITGIPKAFLEIPGVRYAVTSNGAKVYDLAADTVLYEDCLTPQCALELLRVCRAWDVLASVFIDGQAYSDPPDAAKFSGLIPPAMLAYIQASRVPVVDLDALLRGHTGPVEKLNVMFTDAGARIEAREQLTARGDCAVTSSVPGNLEVNSATANKGTALLTLGRLLGLGRAQVMAIGDGTNDTEMLRQVGLGVAMGNAHPQLLQVADAVTAHVEEDGVALAIEKVLAG